MLTAFPCVILNKCSRETLIIRKSLFRNRVSTRHPLPKVRALFVCRREDESPGVGSSRTDSSGPREERPPCGPLTTRRWARGTRQTNRWIQTPKTSGISFNSILSTTVCERVFCDGFETAFAEDYRNFSCTYTHCGDGDFRARSSSVQTVRPDLQESVLTFFGWGHTPNKNVVDGLILRRLEIRFTEFGKTCPVLEPSKPLRTPLWNIRGW